MSPALKVSGALATSKSVQRGAQQVAAHYGVGLYSVQSAVEFAIRYKDCVHLSAGETLLVRDSLTIEVAPAPPVRSRSNGD
jgi:hypothetical protein